ncbi:HEPN domain-containing protein [Ascidiaceihabitans sp.]|uniref:HEPN domain-containing protein n=1 Tax=Ascidiaceihabitans sp. TaxID=1872644 RepID=UPI003297E4BD
MSAAFDKFIVDLTESRKAIDGYDLLEENGMDAGFALRSIWITAVSALDHFITNLVIEKCVENYSVGDPSTGKLLASLCTFENMIEMSNATEMERILIFRNSIVKHLKFRTFQKSEDIADGLSYFWFERDKWKSLSNKMLMDRKSLTRTINGICNRRNLIAHNADFNEATGMQYPVDKDAAIRVISILFRVGLSIEKSTS